MRAPLTMEDYLASRWIVEPLRLYDCCLETDAAVAVVVTTTERARHLVHRPVTVTAAGWGSGHTLFSNRRPDLGTSGSAAASRRLWSQAGLGPADVDVAELYDGFSFLALAWLEALGFCGHGEGGPFIEGGKRIALDGDVPLNTHGGQLSAGRLHGYGFLHEAMVQLRGEGEDRQVPGSPEVAVVANGGGPVAGAMLLTRLG
jgi:acetyl-CoA acetyltransferase